MQNLLGNDFKPERWACARLNLNLISLKSVKIGLIHRNAFQDFFENNNRDQAKADPFPIARNQFIGKCRIQQGSAISQTMAARNDPKTMAQHLPVQEA